MKIIEWSHSARDFMQSFERWFYSKHSSKDCESNPAWVGRGLGKSFSFFIVESDIEQEPIIFEKRAARSSRMMVLLDYDDGNGYKPVDFKLDKRLFNHIMNSHGLSDFIVFKSQRAASSDFCKNYPIPEEDVYPLGYFCNDPNHTLMLKSRVKNYNFSKRDIDVFWCGTVPDYPDSDWKYSDIDMKYWGSRARRLGYEKICEIRDRRDDLNIFVSNETIPFDQYVDLISRSKICVDLPGVGFHTRRLMELLTLEKCALACEKINDLNFDLIDKRHIHRYSIDYSDLESRIDYLLRNPEVIKKTEDNLKEIQHLLTWKHAAENILSITKKRLS